MDFCYYLIATVFANHFKTKIHISKMKTSVKWNFFPIKKFKLTLCNINIDILLKFDKTANVNIFIFILQKNNYSFTILQSYMVMFVL